MRSQSIFLNIHSQQKDAQLIKSHPTLYLNFNVDVVVFFFLISSIFKICLIQPICDHVAKNDSEDSVTGENK